MDIASVRGLITGRVPGSGGVKGIGADLRSVDGNFPGFGKDDRLLGAHPGAGGAVILTVLRRSDDDAFLLNRIDSKRAEAHTLAALNAAIIINDGEPRDPGGGDG